MKDQIISVLCAEDELLIALDLEEAINNESDMRCVGYILDPQLLTEEVATKKPDVLILDLNMSGQDTSNLMPALKTISPTTEIVIFSGYIDSGITNTLIQRGARGFVIKDGNIKRVIEAVRNVADGGSLLQVD